MKEIINYPNYSIDVQGNVYNTTKNTKLSVRTSNSGYYTVSLWKNNKSTIVYIHRLLAIHYISNPNNYEQVNHINGDKLDNSIDNLEWCTRSYNAKHAIENGLKVYTNRLTKDEFVSILYKVLQGMSYKDICEIYPYKVPFMSTKIKSIAKELNLVNELEEELRRQRIIRMERDEFGKIKARQTTVENIS